MGMGKILEELMLSDGKKITQRRRVHRDFAEGKHGEGVPIWEELVYTPAVFVRVANTGVAGYGEWKSAEVPENKEHRSRWSAPNSVRKVYPPSKSKKVSASD